MAKSVREVMGGIFCCIEQKDKPWCDDCPYEHVYNCRNILRSDISYWAALGKMELGKDGIWQPKGSDVSPKRKDKRKHGRRYFSEERRNNRSYESE